MDSKQASNICGIMVISAFATVILFIIGYWGIGIFTGIFTVFLWSIIKDE